jgi:4-alpha-glucanotransferase
MSKRSRPANRFDFDRRASGLLLHPTSLPGRYANGDLGPEAHKFVDFLAAAGQRWWQMLPIGPPGEGNSPYSAASAFAGYGALISRDVLVERGLIKRSETRRGDVLRVAFGRFRERGRETSAEFRRFVSDNLFWLEDFAMFASLKRAQGGRPWSQWEPGVRMRGRDAMDRARRELSDEISYERFVQFEFDRQWRALREKCAADGVGLIGDIPIFVAYDSAEVWANPHLFLLDRVGRPKVVSGCPPDMFSCDGQRWGHPHYNWGVHAREGYRWWIERFRQTLKYFDAVRIDHFLGFHRVWSIAANKPTAKHGKYMPGPGAKFFMALHGKLGHVPIIAEDLGAVTPEALALRDQFDFPGMRVLQFGFGDGGQYHLPHNYPRRVVVYTGTHDNDTTAGWLRSISRKERKKVIDYTHADGESPVWSLIRSGLASVADTAIFPVQDLLELGGESRMNIPGTVGQNWAWRLKPNALTPPVARRLREMCTLYER